MTATNSVPAISPQRHPLTRWTPWAYAVALAAFTGWLVFRSWMRWIDPQIDFGVQLYIPWRMTLGEHLGRDFVHPYGPLSSYLNAALFAIFGVSIRTLVIANLVVFAGILALLYRLFRRTFGFFAAAVATTLAVAVFGFGHYTGVNNYTYAAPYSHEATHGMLLLLALAVYEVGWRRDSARAAWVEGVLLGLICLTKVEIVFAAALLMLVVLCRRWGESPARGFPTRWIVTVVATALAVVALAFALLAMVISPRDAWIAATGGFLAPFLYPSYLKNATILGYIGLDRPVENLRAIVVFGATGLSAAGLLHLLAGAVGRLPRHVQNVAGLIAAVAVGILLVWWLREPPYRAAWALPVLLGAAGWLLAQRARDEHRRRGRVSQRTWGMLLGLVLAVGLMARMALAPKIHHYGFVQAMVAVCWVCAFLIGEMPRSFRQRASRRFYAFVVAAGFAAAAVPFLGVSLKLYSVKTLVMGVGADQILSLTRANLVGHDDMEMTRAYLQKEAAPGSTLLVAPEGIMLNYWTRMKTPLRITNLLAPTLALNRGDVVADLNSRPPDYAVVVTRTVTDDTFPTFGANDASGRRILEWLQQNYGLVARAGDDPLRPFGENRFGLWVLKHRAPAPPVVP